jgi:D-aminopeptidase
VPVGEQIPTTDVPRPGGERRLGAPPASEPPPGSGSIIVVLATDAPLLPPQCDRLAQRAGLGIARTGGGEGNTSGDIFLAFATGNASLPPEHGLSIPLRTQVEMLANAYLSELLAAAIEATEAAVVNALLAAETMVGRDGIVAHRLDHSRLLDILARFGRPARPADR